MMETVKELLDNQPDLIHSQDGDGYTPLHRACYNGHIHMVKVRVVCNEILEKWSNLGKYSKISNIFFLSVLK